MPRKLFCQICPLTYRISVWKKRTLRRLGDLRSGQRFACTRQESLLPVTIYRHASLIRRRLGSVNIERQENKAVNLAPTA